MKWVVWNVYLIGNSIFCDSWREFLNYYTRLQISGEKMFDWVLSAPYHGSGSKKSLFFGKFGVFCFLETPVLRFALLPYYRRLLYELNIKFVNTVLSWWYSLMLLSLFQRLLVFTLYCQKHTERKQNNNKWTYIRNCVNRNGNNAKIMLIVIRRRDNSCPKNPHPHYYFFSTYIVHICQSSWLKAQKITKIPRSNARPIYVKCQRGSKSAICYLGWILHVPFPWISKISRVAI